MSKHYTNCSCCGISFIIDETEYSNQVNNLKIIDGIYCTVCLKLNILTRKEIKYTREFFNNLNKNKKKLQGGK